MLFDFNAFIEELRENPDKKVIVEKYEKVFGTISGEIEDQEWYKEYVSKFETIEYAVPAELKNDFNWGLLLQICASSFSSAFVLTMENDQLELSIIVKSSDQTVKKSISELWSFQILRLYEIYLEEQMNLHALKYDDEKETKSVDNERNRKLNGWNKIVATLKSEMEIDDLLGDL